MKKKPIRNLKIVLILVISILSLFFSVLVVNSITNENNMINILPKEYKGKVLIVNVYCEETGKLYAASAHFPLKPYPTVDASLVARSVTSRGLHQKIYDGKKDFIVKSKNIIEKENKKYNNVGFSAETRKGIFHFYYIEKAIKMTPEQLIQKNNESTKDKIDPPGIAVIYSNDF